MSVITDRHGHVISVEPDTLEDWKQAAEVEAGIRRELQALNAELMEALSGMVELFEDSMVDPELPALDKARAALAKAKGEP